MDNKAVIVHQYTKGRTESTKKMYQNEAVLAIRDLQAQLDTERAPWIKKIAGILYHIANNHKKDWLKEDGKLDYAKALKREGGFKAYKLHEMQQLFNQVNAMKRNYETAKNPTNGG